MLGHVARTVGKIMLGYTYGLEMMCDEQWLVSA